jgi:hypothetical protein
MRRHIVSRDLTAARKTFSDRLVVFFPQVFDEVKESLDRKLAVMKMSQ